MLVPGAGGLLNVGPGATIGHYRVERLLGEGGMGRVFLARQDRPDRRVALKLIRAGLASPRLLRRFELEAEVLGRLQHPGIAQVYQAGTFATATGPQPYFAMEYVEGEDLKRFCERRGLGVNQKLALVEQLAEAVQHAHQKGVVHRDLKPGNILVDAQGRAKILDFGVARLVERDATRPDATEAGQLVGTLGYMSPEQVLGSGVDTRSDVYALGVILHELLAGALPLDLASRTLPEVARAMSEEEPRRLGSINRSLAGDIETIVRKALEKDRARRYQTAAEFGADLRRFLNDEPITARAPSAVYQLRKFARRNRSLVLGGALSVLALVGGLAGTTYGLLEARRERDDAREARRNEQAQREVAEAINEFLNQDLLGAVEPAATGTQGRGKDVTMREVLDEASRRIDEAGKAGGRFADKPLVEAAIRTQLTMSYHKLGAYEEALRHAEKAVTLRAGALGQDDALTLESVNNLGVLLETVGAYARAESQYRRALDGFTRLKGADHPDTLSALNNLGSVLQSLGRLSEAEGCYRRGYEACARKLGADHADTVIAAVNLAGVLSEVGKLKEAEGLLRDSLERTRKARGEDHPETLWIVNKLGALLQATGQQEQAGALYREALAGRERVLGPEHDATLTAKANVGFWLAENGKLEEAAKIQREVLEVRRRVTGPDHRSTMHAMNNLAAVLERLKRFDEAEALQRECLERRTGALGPDHPDTLSSVNNMGMLLRAMGKLEESVPWFRRAAEGFERTQGPENLDVQTVRANLGVILNRMGRFAEAEPLLRSCLAEREKLLPAGHWDLVRTRLFLGEALGGLGRFEEGEGLIVAANEAARTHERADGEDRRVFAERAAELYERWGKAEQARAWRARAESSGPGGDPSRGG
jgi:tetratricopeptide (TPR) repeat protein/predicted Ser/Thr protein kinase